MARTRMSLKDTEHSKQAEKPETDTAVEEILDQELEKDKTVAYKQKKDPQKKWFTGYIKAETWENFTKINEAKGVKSNQVLTMMIADYIQQNKGFLE